jgi:hypothetical protein
MENHLSAEDVRTLLALNKFSFLRTKDLVAYIDGPSESAVRRNIGKLLEDKLVATTTDSHRCHVFALAVKGANALRRMGLEASTTAKFLDGGNYEHRCIANESAIYYSRDSHCSVLSEHEIQQGKHGLLYNFGKMPDYLVRDENFGVIWGEVERTKKSSKDWQKLIRWLLQVTRCDIGHLPEIGLDEYLFRIEFVCNSTFEQRLVNELGQDFCDQWLWFRPLQVTTWHSEKLSISIAQP